MKSFHFRLEKILGWRRTELSAEEARLAPLNLERNRLEAEHIRVAAARDRARRDLLGASVVSGRELAEHATYWAGLAKQQVALQRESDRCAKEMAAQRSRIADAHRRVRLLEKLRARRLAQWTTDWERELDRLASESYLTSWSAETGRE